MASEGFLQDLREKLADPMPRWCLVGILVFILLRLRLVLFAAALPVMVYWHYSREQGEDADSGQAQEERAPNFSHSDKGRRTSFDDGFDAEPSFDSDEVDPYDNSFWQEGALGSKREKGASEQLDSDPLQVERAGIGDLDDSLDAGNDPLSKLLASGGDKDLGSDMDFDFGLGGFGGGGDASLLSGGFDDMDFLGSGFGGDAKGKGKGRGKGKSKTDGGKGKSDGPRAPDLRQIFVAGVGDTDEDSIRTFFEDVGEIDRLKVLRHEDGSSKGVCFVTFRTEEQAQDALRLQGADLDGRRLTVRLANGGKGENGGRGDKGEGKGGRGKGKEREPREPRDNDRSRDFDKPRDFERPRDLDKPRDFDTSRHEPPRGGGAHHRGDDQPDVGQAPEEPRTELDELLEEALEEEDGPLKLADFDAGAKRFLTELMTRDRAQGTQRSVEAIEMVFKQTRSKTRESVRKWPAYVFTLLQKFDPALCDEMAERNLERKMRERDVRRAGDGATRDDVARAWKLAPPQIEGARQLVDRWGKPVVIY